MGCNTRHWPPSLMYFTCEKCTRVTRGACNFHWRGQWRVLQPIYWRLCKFNSLAQKVVARDHQNLFKLDFDKTVTTKKLQHPYIPPSFGCLERLLSFRLMWCSIGGTIEKFQDKHGWPWFIFTTIKLLLSPQGWSSKFCSYRCVPVIDTVASMWYQRFNIRWN